MRDPGLPLLLQCSPRPRGNSRHAARLFLRALHADRDAVNCEELRKRAVLPCVSCGRCGRIPGAPCPLEERDDSRPLLRALAGARSLCLVSPIYFYHLPAQAKALIDRLQPFWEAARRHAAPPPPARPAWVILLAGRAGGEKLFAGSLLTLRYGLGVLNFELMPPLCLYGVDEAGSLARSKEKSRSVTEYAQAAGRRFRDGA
jgi:multimeric flavodoxin WrbA